MIRNKWKKSLTVALKMSIENICRGTHDGALIIEELLKLIKIFKRYKTLNPCQERKCYDQKIIILWAVLKYLPVETCII